MFIEIKDAVKTYNEGENAIHALDKVNLSLEKGEICCILGPSGSGKSTLMNMLGGIDSLDSGNVVVAGADITKFNKKQLTDYRRKDVGFVFQSYNLISDLTVMENINVVRDIAANPLDTEKLMKELEIDKYKHHFPRELSGGQQQRTAIVRAVVKNPSILLCDELTGALDSKSSRGVLKMLEKINNIYGTTIVMITHNEGIAGMADRVIRIHDGQISSNVRNKSKTSVDELDM
jgi:putative ABC transport system ATP-binding protein